jgi:16S rRNA (cytosine967-C5)-methyltransferase
MAAEGAQGIPARSIAQDMLRAVLNKRRPLDTLLDQLSALPSRDAGFARAIVSETLRRFGQLDALIRQFVAKPPPPHKAGPTLEILLAGACELLFLDVPAHAAVDAANRLAQADSKAVHFKPLINAVLRRVSREGKEVLSNQDTAKLNTPDWLWARWQSQYGESGVRAIAEAHARSAPLDVVAKDSFAEGENIFGRVHRLTEAPRIEDLPGFAEGAFWIQDAAATLPAHLLGDVAGKRVFDLCAAPGGKTMQLASKGAIVTAVERESARLARVAENLARTKLSATLVHSDLRDFAPDTPAPFVLLDAPCSATGTIRRHPDLPWIKGASDITLCASAAAEFLDTAADLTAPGGTLVFAVCSLEAEEGLEQVEDFLRRNADFSRAKILPSDIFGLSELISAEGDLRTLPYHLGGTGGMDGFYAARLIRK